MLCMLSMLCPTAVMSLASAAGVHKPHIMWLIVDDLGWNDYPFTASNGSKVYSPTLSKMAAEGTVLNNYYVNPICTPTRASFMSGRYPIHLGLQNGVIRDSIPEGVPLNETMVPQYLKEAGYATHAVGKWHLGFHKKEYTPEARGFDVHYGYYTGNEEYWNHTSPCWHCGNFTALDLHIATKDTFHPLTNLSDTYSTEVFGNRAVDVIQRHDPSQPLFLYMAFEAVHGASSCTAKDGSGNCDSPAGDQLQAPEHYITAQKNITNPFRKTFGGMLYALDVAVLNITRALASKGMSGDTLWLVTTDNGAPDSGFNFQAGSNWPLRGGKGTLWEGGMRGAALVYGAGVLRGVNNTKLFHAADWLPTFAALAGNPVPAGRPLDGYDIWAALTTDAPSPRTEILHNIDPLKHEASVRVGEFKLIVGAHPAGWGPHPDGPSAEFEVAGDSGPWLFNVRDDPQERTNLYNDPAYAHVRANITSALDRYNASAVHCRICDAVPDPSAQPVPVKDLQICTPTPVDPSDPTKGVEPFLCQDVGVWQPWQ
eukprot:Hpha_TRINITY_DN15076_c1_g1::TRINITY_DN15076_c1_g1_i1::g.124907::m.124907/K01135/ARSB; arylsulfatase B